MSQVYLSFNIGNELFAINVLKVLEVLQKQAISPVPKAPDYILGIINFRGDVVPVFNTRLKFNLKSHGENDKFAVVVLEMIKNDETYRIGATVDKVKDVITISDNEISPVPPMTSSFDTEFLSGIVRRDDQFILLIDVDRVFIKSEINSITEVAENGETLTS
jgi:purine-binding chemotaxis protein CheW